MLIRLFFFFLFSSFARAQSVQYEVSFENAIHDEAEVTVQWTNISVPTLEARMSRSSPGRYAVHEFAKNVYKVRATDV